MPKTIKKPENLRVFAHHKLDLDEKDGQAMGDCLFCGKENKFSVNVESGLWDCLSGETKALTRSDGYVPLRSLVGKSVELLSHLGWEKAEVKSGGVQKVFKLSLIRDRHKKEIFVTAGHRWFLKDGRTFPTRHLKKGQKLRSVISPLVTKSEREGIAHGIMFGDGNNFHVELWGIKKQLLKFLDVGQVSDRGVTDNGVPGIRVNGQKPLSKTLPTYEDKDSYLLGFLQGYFATDGTVASGTACIDCVEKETLEYLRGIAARVGLVTSPVAGYWRKGFSGHEGYLYRLSFHRISLTPEFFIRDDQRESFVANGGWGEVSRLSWKVTDIEPAGEEEVFCAVVPGGESFALEDNLLTGNCKVCGASGNPLSFIRKLWEESDKATSDYDDLAEDRGLLDPTSLMHWGAARSIVDGEWLIPGYNAERKLCQVYRYVFAGGSKRVMLPTPGMGLHPSGLNLFDPAKETCYVIEGFWNAVAFWEIANQAKEGTDCLLPTGSPQSSILKDANVISFPGCGSIGKPLEKWAPLLANKKVILIADSDHSREANGQVIPPTGWAALERAAKILTHCGEAPESIHCLKWGMEGFDPEAESGFDVRDYLEGEKKLPIHSMANLWSLLQKIEPIPEGWVEGRTAKGKAKGKPEIELLPCTTWKELQASWVAAMEWTVGLENALLTMLASIMSTEADGQQLWMMILGPPSCGKSTLCEAVSVNKKYIFAKSTLTGIHSGYSDSTGEEDNSCIPLMNNKTFVVKDGDPLIKHPNKETIFAQLRDLFDRVTRVKYGNKVNRDYENINLTIILCGTSAMKEIDQSELGERFLTCEIMNGIDLALERKIMARVSHQAFSEMALKSGKNLKNDQESLKTKAMQLTGGYVTHLRENAQEVFTRIVTKPGQDEAINYCSNLGLFVAYLRARPSKTQTEMAQREIAARLPIQFTRMAVALTGVMNKEVIDKEVLEVCRQVAFSSAAGTTLKMVDHLWKAGKKGCAVKPLANACLHPESKVRDLLAFLRKIHAVELVRQKTKAGVVHRPLWALADSMRELYENVNMVEWKEPEKKKKPKAKSGKKSVLAGHLKRRK